MDNLKYLNSEQALEDIVSFIQFITTSRSLTSANKWISFGCSYSGALSAWLRLRYPHLVYGAISGSSALRFKLDFFEYYEGIANSISNFSSTCSNNLISAQSAISTLLKTSAGQNQLKSIFKYINL